MNYETSYRISIVYLPTNQNIDKESIQYIVRKLRICNQATNYMILGDFNFIDHFKDKTNSLSHKDIQINKLWVPFLEEMDMVDPFREQNIKRKIWSFIGSGVAGNSRIPLK